MDIDLLFFIVIAHFMLQFFLLLNIEALSSKSSEFNYSSLFNKNYYELTIESEIEANIIDKFFSYIIPNKNSWFTSLFSLALSLFFGFIFFICTLYTEFLVENKLYSKYHEFILNFVMTRKFILILILLSGFILGVIKIFNIIEKFELLLKNRRIQDAFIQWKEKELFRRNLMYNFVFNSKFVIPIIAGISLINATQPQELEFYQILRIYITGYCVVLIAGEDDFLKKLFFAPIILLFNPIIKMRFEQNIWQIVDIVCASIFFFYALIEVKKYFSFKPSTNNYAKSNVSYPDISKRHGGLSKMQVAIALEKLADIIDVVGDLEKAIKQFLEDIKDPNERAEYEKEINNFLLEEYGEKDPSPSSP